jgi:hypothetical protein
MALTCCSRRRAGLRRLASRPARSPRDEEKEQIMANLAANVLVTARERGDQPAVRLDGHVLSYFGWQAAAAAVAPRV